MENSKQFPAESVCVIADARYYALSRYKPPKYFKYSTLFKINFVIKCYRKHASLTGSQLCGRKGIKDFRTVSQTRVSTHRQENHITRAHKQSNVAHNALTP